jgi:hypothetical protein
MQALLLPAMVVLVVVAAVLLVTDLAPVQLIKALGVDSVNLQVTVAAVARAHPRRR